MRENKIYEVKKMFINDKKDFTKKEIEEAKSWESLNANDILEDICKAAAEELNCVICCDYYNAMFFFPNGQSFRIVID